MAPSCAQWDSYQNEIIAVEKDKERYLGRFVYVINLHHHSKKQDHVAEEQEKLANSLYQAPCGHPKTRIGKKPIDTVFSLSCSYRKGYSSVKAKAVC